MYSELFELHASLLKALAHQRRLEIIHLLRDQELCVSDIYEMLDLPQANISQHLMILREAGVVVSRRDGKQICYKLSDPRILEACDKLRAVLIDKHAGTVLAENLQADVTKLLPLTHDPVCGMRLSPRTAGATYHYQNHDFYFCASGCHKKFSTNPEAYVQTN